MRDFNLMLRRGRAQGSVVVVRDAAARASRLRAGASATSTAGAVECLVPGHPPVSVALDDTVAVRGRGDAAAGALAINPVSAGAVALVAVIEPVS